MFIPPHDRAPKVTSQINIRLKGTRGGEVATQDVNIEIPIVVEIGIALGALLYGGVGLVSMMLGGEFLDYGVLDGHDAAHGQHLGILLVELGVGITVSFVMVAIFYSFAGRSRQ